MDRMQAFDNLSDHPWFGKLMKKLRPPARDIARIFLAENYDKTHDEIIPMINRLFLDKAKPKQWELVTELLTAAAVAASQEKLKLEV